MKVLAMRLWPKRLFPRMMLLILLALLLAQGISFWVLASAHREALRDSNQRFQIRQFVSLVQLLEQIPAVQHRQALKAWRQPGRKMAVMSQPPIAQAESKLERRLENLLVRLLGAVYQGRVRVNLKMQTPHGDKPHWHRREPFYRDDRRPIAPHPLSELTMAVHLQGQLSGNDGWFVSVYKVPKLKPMVALPTLVFVGVSSVLVLLVVFWQLRKITRPLASLATAANALGRGQQVAVLPEEGPDDVQLTLKAFNHMNERLQRFVSDRTRMLAALSHDLRTPITSMRLRLELMEPGEHRDKLLQSLDEMQQMSEATLAFVRQSGDVEASSVVDCGALLGSLSQDLGDLGMLVRFSEPSRRITLEARPVALKRALRNLIENAVHYGEEARIELSETDTDVIVQIQDRGTGIPESELESVFEPFYRVEASRSRETGGMGLGMSIAQQIVSSHGGQITLENTQPGLLVRLQLPKS